MATFARAHARGGRVANSAAQAAASSTPLQKKELRRECAERIFRMRDDRRVAVALIRHRTQRRRAPAPHEVSG